MVYQLDNIPPLGTNVKISISFPPRRDEYKSNLIIIIIIRIIISLLLFLEPPNLLLTIPKKQTKRLTEEISTSKSSAGPLGFSQPTSHHGPQNWASRSPQESQETPRYPWLPSRKLTYPPDKTNLKMIFLFPRWDMLVPWRVIEGRPKKKPPIQWVVVLSRNPALPFRNSGET